MSTIVQLGSQLIGLAILARMLTPADFGITAPSIAIVGVLAVIAEFGLGAALIQRAGATREDVGSAIWLVLFNATLLSGVVFALLPLIAGMIGLAEPAILGAAVMVIFFMPVASILECINLKHFRFRRVLIAAMIASITGNLMVPVTLALLGTGLWALVAIPIAMPLAKILVLAIAMRPCRLPPFSMAAIRRMGHFSSYFTVTKVLSMISLQGDRIALAHAVSPAALGLYTRAQNFSQLIITFLTSAFEKVLFPILTHVQDDAKRTRIIYIQVFFFITTLAGIISAIAATMAHTLLVILLGSQWSAAAGLASVFAAMIFLRCLDRLAAILLRSHAMMKERAILQAFLAVSTLAACFLVIPYGLLAVAWSIVGLNAAGALYTQFVVARFLGLRLGEIVLPICRSAIIAGIYVAGYYAQSTAYPSLPLHFKQPMQATVSAIATLLVVVILNKSLLGVETRELAIKLAHFRRSGRKQANKIEGSAE